MACNLDQSDDSGLARVGPAAAIPILLPVAVACGNFMTGLDQNVVITALPAIGKSLDVAPTALGLTLTAYLTALIVALPTGGWFCERFGTRRAYIGAALLFTVASVMCGLAVDFWELVVVRALQGLGGALMGTVGHTVILGSFPPHRRLRVVTYVSLANQASPMVGPLVGGLLTTYVSWRWIFLINLPIGLFVALMAARLFPNRRSGLALPFDLPGFFLVGAGMTLLALGLNALADHETAPWGIVAQLGVGALLLALAIRHCLQSPNALLDLNLLRLRTLRVSLVTGGGTDGFGLTAAMFILPLMFQVGFGMTAARSGSLTFLAAAGSVSVRAFLPLIVKRLGFRRLLVTNIPILAAFVVLFSLFQPSTPSWLIGGTIFSFGVLRSFQWGSTANLSYAEVPPESLARFSALFFVTWNLAIALSVGSASAAVALLAGQGTPTVGNFHTVLLIAAAVTMCALPAYLSLKAQDGRHLIERLNVEPGPE